jgi:hypothetical protein
VLPSLATLILTAAASGRHKTLPTRLLAEPCSGEVTAHTKGGGNCHCNTGLECRPTSQATEPRSEVDTIAIERLTHSLTYFRSSPHEHSWWRMDRRPWETWGQPATRIAAAQSSG